MTRLRTSVPKAVHFRKRRANRVFPQVARGLSPTFTAPYTELSQTIKTDRPEAAAKATVMKSNRMKREAWSAILRHYNTHGRRRAADELDWFAQFPSLDHAIARGATATDARGKRFNHQRRISKGTLAEAHKALRRARSAIQASKSFDELINVVSRALEDVFGVGELYCYDTAFRLGGYLRIYPERVYLHSGTREGARALGILVGKRDALEIAELPKELRGLLPHEIEDVLCIYKGQFSRPQSPIRSSFSCAPSSHLRP